MRRIFHRWTAIILLFAMIPCGFGCFGHFPLTRTVYSINDEIGDVIGGDSIVGRFFSTVLMWVFLWIPVYSIAMIGDAIILNLIEFWTGEALGSLAYVHENDDGTVVALNPLDDGNTAELTISKDGKVIERQYFVRVSDNVVEARDAEGAARGRIVHTGAGDLRFTDMDGNLISTLPADEIESFVEIATTE